MVIKKNHEESETETKKPIEKHTCTNRGEEAEEAEKKEKKTQAAALLLPPSSVLATSPSCSAQYLDTIHNVRHQPHPLQQKKKKKKKEKHIHRSIMQITS